MIQDLQAGCNPERNRPGQGVGMKFGCFSKSARPSLALFAVVLFGMMTASADAKENVADRGAASASPTSTADEPDARWFPDLSDSIERRPPPILSVSSPQGLLPREQPLIPLPAAGWSGLIGLCSLALIVGRKALLRFVS